MNTATDEEKWRTPVDQPHERRRTSLALIVAVVVLAGAGVAVGLSDPFSSGAASPAGDGDNGGPTSLYTVTRQDLSSQTQVPATLGYADSYSVVNQAPGTVTELPAVGQVVSEGQVLYQMSAAPVVLLYGSTPAYRTLSLGLSGPDVEQLNSDLVALGEYPSGEQGPTSDAFNFATADGVKNLQSALGVTQTGSLTFGQVVFLPSSARITSVAATLGAPAQTGQPVLSATSTTRQVNIALDASQQSEVTLGDKVTVTLPNNQTTPGLISSVGTVAAAPAPGSSNNSPTITVLVKLTDPPAAGTEDQAPVNVTITTGSVTNVLVVPVDALLAKSSGAYEVEVAAKDGGRHLVAVTLGLFDDAAGLVQVSGSGLAAGQRVVVPTL
jgi:peptidoglycan hydrolase-like protein with peptidoglycan-binding domain